MASLSVAHESDDLSDILTSPSICTEGGSSPLTEATTTIPSLSPHTPTFGQDVIPEIRLPDRGEEEDVVSGWPKLARLMIATPEFESFCRFRELNVKTLLYYQVELAQLEQKLKKVEKRDSGRRDSDEGKYAKFAVNMIPRNDNPNDSATPKQWRLIKKIRKVLKEYNHALRQYTEISAMSEPDYRNVESLRVWLKRANMGAYCISGAGSDVWGDLYKPEDDISFDDRCRNFLKSIIGGNTSQNTKFDLVSTHPRQQEDGLTHWLLKEWTTFYHAYRSSRQRNGQKDVEKFQGRAEGQNSRTPGQLRSEYEKYSRYKIVKFTSYVATMVACMLPTVAIAVLSAASGTLKENGIRIGLISLFTAVFAIGLMLLTETGTSRVQIFTGTAAFTAVLVVFVQNQ